VCARGDLVLAVAAMEERCRATRMRSEDAVPRGGFTGSGIAAPTVRGRPASRAVIGPVTSVMALERLAYLAPKPLARGSTLRGVPL
jgi:hypothetical protein